MRYVVLDTNCLIQAIPSKSRYHKIWTDFLEGRYIMCVSNEILSEYEEILSRLMSAEVATNIVEAIARHPKVYYCEAHFRFRLLHDIDKDDDKFVDCAIASNADYIVTDDNHFNHLKKIQFPSITILSLDEFYNSL